MVKFFYSFGLKVLSLLIRLAAFFNPKAKEFIHGRQRVWTQLEKQLGSNTSPVLWVHCASVGEYEQGRPVMEAFKQAYPTYKILVTFYSPSGYQAIEPNATVDFKTYLPTDSRQHAARFIDLVKPQLVFFIKYEFWHFYLTELHQRKIPTFSVSSIFRPTQVFFKWYGSFYKKMLHNFTFFFVQDKTSARLLAQAGLPHMLTGDTRLDRVLTIREHKKPIKDIEKIANNHKVMVVGSLRKEDIDLVSAFINRHPELKFIVAPHDITEATIRPLEKNVKSTIRYSKMVNLADEPQVIIIDNVGMLSQLYQYGQYAYVGGGFSDGLHNILEPAVFGIPVFFGNKQYQKFKEAIDLIDLGAAFPVGSYQEFDKVFTDLQERQDQLATIRKSIDGYLNDNKGAAKKIIHHLQNYLP